MACTLAPAVEPLCAIGVAMATPLTQLCPGRFGIFAGYIRYTMGTFQEISPMSSDPPPAGFFTGSVSGSTFSLRPSTFAPISF